ncbi:MAG TPA: hypothetical protein VD815_04020 [Candidatus Saccharimonadales bacterium]|nr:hypothetical protein [Candidatus Saccharimonadales bacterium]
MGKLSDYDDDKSARHNVESFVLYVLYTQQSLDDSGPSVNINT